MTRTVRDTERCQHRTQERPHVQLNSSRGVDRLSLREKGPGGNKIVTEFICVYVNTAQEAGKGAAGVGVGVGLPLSRCWSLLWDQAGTGRCLN
jgi:hypothetical protein